MGLWQWLAGERLGGETKPEKTALGIVGPEHIVGTGHMVSDDGSGDGLGLFLDGPHAGHAVFFNHEDPDDRQLGAPPNSDEHRWAFHDRLGWEPAEQCCSGRGAPGGT